MKTRPVIVLLFVAIAGTVTALHRWNRQDEPRYQGKTLSAWLANDELTQRERREALLGMGTNTVPALLRMLQETNSSFHNGLLRFVCQHSFLVPWLERSNWPLDPAGEHRQQAENGFLTLGTNAAPFVPELARILQANPSIEIEVSALKCLAASGPAGQAHVFVALTNTNAAIRIAAIQAAWGFQKPQAYFALLTNALSDASPYVQEAAINRLAWFGTNAKPAIPLILEKTNSLNRRVRGAALYNLSRIDPQAFPSAESSNQIMAAKANEKIIMAVKARYGIRDTNAPPVERAK